MSGAVAVVVARGGSRRLPGKALLPFGDSTLIGHKVDTLRRCEHVERVIVGSDSEVILTEAFAHGAETMRRDPYFCDETKCSANEMIRDIAGRIDADDETVVLWAHPTNPLIRGETYDAAIAHFRASRCDSLLSVIKIQRHAWMHDTPINYDPYRERHTPASEVTPIYFQDGGIFIQTLRRFKETRYFFGSTPQLFVLDADEATDIDTWADYQEALSLWGLRRAGQNN
jgi:CMP-N,N'-diacetyllegionaminic acid synthase